jgi:hypothetical protein
VSPRGEACAAAGDYEVTVCAACLTATCWHGVFMCQKAKQASTMDVRASELRALGREHPDNFSRERILRVTGSMPREVRS